MPYLPPDSNDIVINFGGVYKKPPAQSINIEFAGVDADIRQASIKSGVEFGKPSVQSQRFLVPKGFQTNTSNKFKTLVDTNTPRIYPSWTEGDLFGTPSFSWEQTIFAQSVRTNATIPSTSRIRWLGGYNSPPAQNTILNWLDEPYSKPPAFNVILEFGALGYYSILGATLFDQSAIGSPSVTQGLGAITPVWVHNESGRYGLPRLDRSINALRPSGFNAARYGQSVLTLSGRQISPSGFKSTPEAGSNIARQIPLPFISYLIRELRPNGYTATIYGLSVVSGGIRVVDLAGRGPFTQVIPSQRISFRERLISISGHVATVFGNATMGRELIIEAIGDDLALFGNPEFNDNSLWLYLDGYDAQLHGQPFIAMAIRDLVAQPSNLGVEFGLGNIRNNTRIIENYSEVGYWGPFWSTFTLIENRDRVSQTFGHSSYRSGLATIELGARALLTDGFSADLHSSSSLVAYAIRQVNPPSLLGTGISRWSIVYNAARVVEPFGVKLDEFGGYLYLTNTRREIKQVSEFEQLEIGTAFADFAIRNVNALWGIDAPYVPIPSVIFARRWIYPVSNDPQNLGVPFLEEKFTTIAPRYEHTDRLGNPFIRNRNRTVTAMGYDLSLYGQAEIENFITYSEIGGIDFQLIGRPDVADTRRILFVAPLLATRIPLLHRIFLGDPDRPFARTLLPVGWDEQGAGAGSILMGRPSVFSNIIFAESFYKGLYGSPTIYSNGISPPSFWVRDFDRIGQPSLNGLQYITLEQRGIAAPYDGSNNVLHRVSPHTIWCTKETTTQARRNHPPARYFFVGESGPSGQNVSGGWSGSPPLWGRPTLTNQHRTIQHRHSPTTGYSNGDFLRLGQDVRVELKTRTLIVNGTNFMRFGFPSIPSGVFNQAYGTDFLVMGQHQIYIYVPPVLDREIYPTGSNHFISPSQNIELLNRSIFPAGYINTSIPRVQRVGPPARADDAGGFDASIFGEHWASHKIRHLLTQGSVHTIMDYSTGFFDRRMKVFKTPEPPPSDQYISSAGSLISSIYGNAAISNNARLITPLYCGCMQSLPRPIVQHS